MNCRFYFFTILPLPNSHGKNREIYPNPKAIFSPFVTSSLKKVLSRSAPCNSYILYILVLQIWTFQFDSISFHSHISNTCFRFIQIYLHLSKSKPNLRFSLFKIFSKSRGQIHQSPWISWRSSIKPFEKCELLTLLHYDFLNFDPFKKKKKSQISIW